VIIKVDAKEGRERERRKRKMKKEKVRISEVLL
jgi:hypothetical protein